MAHGGRRIAPAIPCDLRPLVLAVGLALAGTAHGAVFTPGDAAASDPPSQSAAAPDSGDYVLAPSPVRWWGMLALDLRYRDLSEAGQGRTEVLSGSINAATYVWQPWFLQVTGSVGLVAALDHTESTGNATSVNGIGSLDATLFPSSRFPFNLYADVSDTRAEGQVTDIDYRAYRFRVSQSYVPAFGNERYYGSYEQSILRTVNSTDTSLAPGAGPPAEDTLEILRLGAAKSWQTQSLEGEVSVSRNRREEATFMQQSKLDVATARHTLLPGPRFSMTNGLSYTRTAIEAPQSQSTLPSFLVPGTSSDTQFTQFTSFTTYRPYGDSVTDANSVLATATLRAFDFSNDVDGDSTGSRGATASLGLSYTLSPQTQLYSTTQAGYATDTFEGVSAVSQSLGITYSGDPILFGPYRYNWTVGSSAIAGYVNGGRLDGGDVVLQATASQALSRGWDLGQGNTLTASFSQSAGYSHGTRLDGEGVLNNTLTGYWNGQGSENSQAFAGLTFSDSRRFGLYDGYFQLANAQANIQMSLSRWETLAAGLTLQATRAETDQDTVFNPDPLVLPEYGRWAYTFGANVSYTHSRAFGVPRLLYALLIQSTSFDLESRALGNSDAPLVQADWLVDNRLQYPIGRLLVQAGVRWAELQNRGSSFQAFIRLQRNFGAL